MVKIMKPYRSEPVNSEGVQIPGQNWCSEHSLESDVFWTFAPSDLVQNNISLKITFEVSSLVFVSGFFFFFQFFSFEFLEDEVLCAGSWGGVCALYPEALEGQETLPWC